MFNFLQYAYKLNMNEVYQNTTNFKVESIFND